MFKKLLGNLPFNPSLIDQVAFYAKRLRAESKFRAIGFLVLVLALIVQVFAVIAPPQSSLALSDNDLFKGGFRSQTQAINACNGNTGNYKTVMAYFGISCADIAHASNVNIKSTDYGHQLYSMGRIPYAKAGEKTVGINGINYYMRYLWSWDTHGASNYGALQGHNSKGATFFILYSCGNLVIIGPPKAPSPKDVCKNLPGIQTDVKQCDVCKGIKGVQLSKALCDVCPKVPGIQSSSKQCLPCPKSVTVADTANCLVLAKSASNLTQHVQNANDTTAKPGDEILYTLTTTNTAQVAVTYQIKENLADVLEYADLVDAHGGVLNPDDKIISWPIVNIASLKSVNHQITVKVKSPLPKTPQSTSNPGSFDLVMTNVYGNPINIKLPQPPAKRIEKIAKSLPNTGPGGSVLIIFGITTIVGYLFARSRLMAKELDIVRANYNSEGEI